MTARLREIDVVNLAAINHEIDVMNPVRISRGFPGLPYRTRLDHILDNMKARRDVLTCATIPDASSCALGRFFHRDGDHAIMTRVLQFGIRALASFESKSLPGAPVKLMQTRAEFLDYMNDVWRARA